MKQRGKKLMKTEKLKLHIFIMDKNNDKWQEIFKYF
jgi:hypothetical protein